MSNQAPQTHEPFIYIAELQRQQLVVRELDGVEGLSRPFSFEMTFVTKDGDIFDPDQFVGGVAVIRVERAGQVLRRLSGVVVEASLNGTGPGAPEAWVRVEPRLSLLQHKFNHRVFRDMTAVEIVQMVLGQAQIGTQLRLREDYKRRPYCVQFRETDLDFVHRLLEEEGIFYFFPDHLEGLKLDPKAQHMVILADNAAAYDAIVGGEEMPFRPVDGLRRDVDHVIEIRHRAKMAPGKVTLRDWNLEKPSLDMDVSAAGPTQGGVEWYDYPGKYELPEEGQRRVDVMGESLARSARFVEGRCDTARLAVGRTISVTDVPDGIPERLALRKLVHSFRQVDGGQGQSQLRVEFEAFDASLTYRPPIITPRPVINNPLTAYVVGPEGEDIHTDEFARVKVHFPWDRQMARDDNASHWVPVLQDNTGSSGAMPRVGWEMLVGFVEGDPDRQMVLGRVYNPKDPFPEPLPAGKTKTALRSLSSPSRVGHNEIWVEDAAGRELVSMQSEKDQNVVVANDKSEDVLNTEENTVLENETISIGSNNTEQVGAKQMTTVVGDQRVTIGGNRSRTVGRGDQATINGDRSMTIGGMHFRKIGGFDNVVLGGSLGETIGGLDLEGCLQRHATTAAALKTLTVGGAVIEIAGQEKKEDTDMFRMETIGVALITKVLTTFDMKVGTLRTTTIGGLLAVKALTVALVAAKKLTAKALGSAEMTGTEGIVIRSGGSEVTITAGGITMKSDKDIVITAAGASNLDASEASLN